MFRNDYPDEDEDESGDYGDEGGYHILFCKFFLLQQYALANFFP